MFGHGIFRHSWLMHLRWRTIRHCRVRGRHLERMHCLPQRQFFSCSQRTDLHRLFYFVPCYRISDRMYCLYLHLVHNGHVR